MIKVSTIKQKIVLLCSILVVMLNSLMAISQIQNYHRTIEYGIISIQDSDSIKTDLGKLLEESDKMAATATKILILISMISVILVVLLVFIVVKSFQIQNQRDTGMMG